MISKAKETQDFKSDHLKILLPTTEQNFFCRCHHCNFNSHHEKYGGQCNIWGRIGNSCSHSSRHNLEFHLIIHLFKRKLKLNFGKSSKIIHYNGQGILRDYEFSLCTVLSGLSKSLKIVFLDALASLDFKLSVSE